MRRILARKSQTCAVCRLRSDQRRLLTRAFFRFLRCCFWWLTVVCRCTSERRGLLNGSAKSMARAMWCSMWVDKGVCACVKMRVYAYVCVCVCICLSLRLCCVCLWFSVCFSHSARRGERKKWIHVFEDQRCIIFVVALDCYDMVCSECLCLCVRVTVCLIALVVAPV